ncbi:hypothetical protein BaRGS_00026645 [Batillaria attramentaria]|uniref:Centrosomal protein of 70 kDa n=1 Tax=Batillaria attramentaria TaxID=370345 RepID=A0ABD0K400_9CAEN
MYRDDEPSLSEEDLYHGGRSMGETSEWVEVNRQLRKQGFQTLRILAAKDVPVSSGRYVCLDPECSENLRHTLLTLLAEGDHRQTLIQDLMDTIKCLKDDVASQTLKSNQAQTRAKDLKIMLECSRARVQELEKEQKSTASQFVDESEMGRNMRNTIHKRCQQLEEAFAEKELEMDKLKKKLRVMREEEQKRVKRQNQVFMEFKKRTARAHSVLDEKLLDIIDLYEGQLHDLKQELEAYRSGESRAVSFDKDGPPFTSTMAYEPTKNAKSLIKGLEKQLREADKKSKALEEERELMTLEMNSRPQMKDYRLMSLRVKKLERLLALHSISIPGEKTKRDPFHSKRKFSTHLEDLDYLPVDFCQQFLRDICAELGVVDVERVVPEIRGLSDRLEASRKYENRMEDPSRAGRRHQFSRPDSALSEASAQHSLGVIENWRRDINQLQALQEALNRLLEQLCPRARIHLTSNHTVADMTEIIERLADEETTVVTKGGYEHISRSTLEGIVEHFQTLFDISTVSGVLPRMNEIYRRLGEAQNVQNTLRNLLGLAEDASSSSVVDAVGRLCQAHNSTTSRQLQQLFETDDLGSVIRRLDEHTQFFPAFKEIMCKLFEILGVERMDQIVPAVRALKLLAS